MKVILASGSPRRLDLLRRIGVEPAVQPPDIDETPLPEEEPEAMVERLAQGKAATVEAEPDTLVVAADTIVVLDGRVLGKPTDRQDAAAMLRRMSGRTHRVLTGVAVRLDGRAAVSSEETAVTFLGFGEEVIDAYVATGEPDDKAGAYGYQDRGRMLVDAIDGSETNVIGLPLELFTSLVRRVRREGPA